MLLRHVLKLFYYILILPYQMPPKKTVINTKKKPEALKTTVSPKKIDK